MHIAFPGKVTIQNVNDFTLNFSIIVTVKAQRIYYRTHTHKSYLANSSPAYSRSVAFKLQKGWKSTTQLVNITLHLCEETINQ